MERQPLIPAADAENPSYSVHSRWLLAGVLLLSLIVRGGALGTLRGNLDGDPDAYRQIAEGWCKSGVYTRDVPLGGDPPAQVAPTAYRPPLYPLCLAALANDNKVWPLAVAALHLLLGLATVALVFWIGMYWKLGGWSAVAAVLVACDPVLLQQSTLVMTETLATFLAVFCLALLTRYDRHKSYRALALAGAGLGLAILCRPTFLPWLLLSMFPIVAQSNTWRERILKPAILVLAAACVLAPWAIRNYNVFQQPIVTTTHGGYTLWLANNDSFYDYLALHQPLAWDVMQADSFPRPSSKAESPAWIERLHQVSPELAADAQANRAARKTILRRPAMFLYSCLVRVGYLWSPLPQKTQVSESTLRALARYLVCLWYIAVYGLMTIGLWSVRKQLLTGPWIWGLTLCIAVTAIHTVYWSNIRMRAPLMPVVALLATAGILECTTRPPTTLRR